MKKSLIRLMAGLTVVSLLTGAVLVQPKLSDWAQLARTGHKANVTIPMAPSFINHGNLKEPDNHVRQGDLFFVYHHFSKALDCQVQATRYLYSAETKTYYSFATTATLWMAPGDYDFNEAYTLPDNVPPGEYEFASKTISRCAGQDFYTLSFSVKIVVLPALPEDPPRCHAAQPTALPAKENPIRSPL